jgi:hypothetical protein
MTQDNNNPWDKDWLKVGGILGAAILLSRVTRTPLAAIINVLPFLLPHFRKAQQQASQNPQGQMNRAEAALILGVKERASVDEIRDAHRRLIQKNHPDQGGSDYLAAKINQARDVLIGKVK